MTGRRREMRKPKAAPALPRPAAPEATPTPAAPWFAYYDRANPRCAILVAGCRGYEACTHRDLAELAARPGATDEELAGLARTRVDYAALTQLLARSELPSRTRGLVCENIGRGPYSAGMTAVWQLHKDFDQGGLATLWTTALGLPELSKANLLAMLQTCPPTPDTVRQVLRHRALTPLAQATLAYRIREAGTGNIGEHGTAGLLADALTAERQPLASISYALSGIPADPSWSPKLLMHRSRALVNSAAVSPEAFAAVVASLAPGWTSDVTTLLQMAKAIVT